MQSVCLHREWSMGHILDIYWQFGDQGDCYLGRCLAGLHPDEPGFGILPPHFSTNNLLSVKKAV